jgi:hypothetical protein
MSRPSLLAACLVINSASLLFQLIVFAYSNYGHAGMTAYTILTILYNFLAWEASSDENHC